MSRYETFKKLLKCLVNELELKFKNMTGINFNEFFNEHRIKLRWHLNRYSNDVDTFDDIIVDTFIKVFKYLDNYDNKYSIVTWVYKIAENEIKFKHKHRKFDYVSLDNTLPINGTFNDIIPSEEDKYEIDLIEEQKITEQKVKFVFDHIYELKNEKYKKALILREIEHLEYKEIADELKLNINTVKQHIMLGRQEIAKKLKRKFK